MRQKEIWYADLNPTKGNEQSGYRPIVIISGNLLNTYLKVIIACPLTSKIKNYKGNLIIEPNETNGLETKSEVLTFHVRSVSKARLVRKIGVITDFELKTIKTCLDEILTY